MSATNACLLAFALGCYTSRRVVVKSGGIVHGLDRGGNSATGNTNPGGVIKNRAGRKQEKTRPGLFEGGSRRFPLLVTEYYPGLAQIIGRHFDVHLVTFQHANAKFAHFARSVGQDFMTVLQLDLEHGIGQTLQYRTRKL